MRTARTITEVREVLSAQRRAEATIGLVATMGALHDGHRSLLQAARKDCDIVVMSLFVNPTQFGAGEDFAGYPRDEAADATLAEQSGVDLLFVPTVEEMYAEGAATSVVVRGITEQLEGAHRGAAHFEGVATIVTKLLNIVAPDVAYFGQKDAQQVLVIERLVRDLAIPTRIIVCPTLREPDGLAMSSRNAYLAPAALDRAASLIGAGERDATTAAAVAQRELHDHDIDAEYFAIVDPATLEAVDPIDRPVLVAVAARVGPARLIDNVLATPAINHTESR
jgi:pantoate--beta-alanine ligase